MLEVQGRMLSLMDEGAGKALFGHELGHNRHGPWIIIGSTVLASMLLADLAYLSLEQQVHLAHRLSMAQEVTADRFGLIACGDIDAALRLEMITTTGLS